MHSIQTPDSTLPPSLVAALRRMLRPIIKLMLSKGITYPFLLELLKELFVEIADKDFKIEGKSSTDSHLSLLTGIHRKDIKRLRHENHSDAEAIPQAVSMGARLVSLWTSDARYLDENNQPKPLPRFIKEGGEISFEKLVANVSCDIRSRVVLDEWLRLGIAHFDEQKRVCLNTSAFVPANGFDEKVYYFGHNLHDHAAAATNNLLGEHQPFFERSVSYDELTVASVQELAEKTKHLGMESLLAINKDAMEFEKSDAGKNEPYYRMTFGIYFYSEPAESKESKESKE
ncbi:DUF6502 family protein [Nitrosomonas ureae]|uniref:Uncharacterized protein n=2 Tax=Nitrosomonas ureae TaxID=44577 RepID=A0A1H9AND0_9PROT|nr:DUF6502 family protein [Nitrosomonas ureae]SEP78169.1 hypothetical protein SAMN05421510_100465 [Nitrosomonas ureae]SOD18659.1 hypothetical protein SAMN06297164_1784 [Nitrosomonas ureae]